MGKLFDLLQGQVQRWDGVRDHTLENKMGKKNSKKNFLKVIFLPADTATVMYCTSGGVFVVGVVREVLEEALDGEGLTDSLESLSASLACLPFTCREQSCCLTTNIFLLQFTVNSNLKFNVVFIKNF